MRFTASFTGHRVNVASAALDFREWLGGEQKINDYCHSLALSGGKLLSEFLGTPLLDPTGEFTLNMVNVGLPLPPSIPENADTLGFLLRNLIEDWNVSAAVFRHNGRWWMRASAQVWNEVNFETCSGCSFTYLNLDLRFRLPRKGDQVFV